MVRHTQRRVDWVLIEGTEAARAHLASPSGQTVGAARITSALLSNPSAATIDRVLREVVELARDAIRLERAAIYLVTPGQSSMVGTWGTDAEGHTTDEHDLMYLMNDLLREFFARVEQGFAWSIYQDCPLVTHDGGRSRTIGRGWNAYTVIRGAGAPIGILFNDSALTGAPVEEGKQARAAVLCSLVGRALEPHRARIFDPKIGGGVVQHPLVSEAAHWLTSDPSLAFVDLAARLRVTKASLIRTFRRHTGTSIVDYRNELRLAQFLDHVNEKPVLAAALEAGFGSYVQFNRIFRARFGKAPRDYLFEHRGERSVRHAGAR